MESDTVSYNPLIAERKGSYRILEFLHNNVLSAGESSRLASATGADSAVFSASAPHAVIDAAWRWFPAPARLLSLVGRI